jgi:hypothetical protein
MEVAMRQPTNAILESLIAALPDKALRPLILALLQNGASADTPVEPMRTPRHARRPRIVAARAKRRGGWPLGKKRGPGRPRLDADTAAAKLAARRDRNNELARARRAAARAARTGDTGSGADNGSAKAVSAEVTPARFWGHAEALAPTKPWRIVARELGVNEQLALDCHRNRSIPPALGASAIERFLETSPS